MFTIVIPCWNKVEVTEQCVQSIQAYTPEEHEIIFIDNGSTDGTNAYLKSLHRPGYMLIENPKNMGFPVAVNQGVQMAQGEYIVILNNDVLVSPEWLTGMRECMESRPDIGIVGPMTNCISGPQQEQNGSYKSLFEFIEFSKGYRNAFRKRYVPWWRIVGFCMMVKREVFDKVGLFDERFSPGNFEDDDFCIRAFLEGYIGCIAGDVFVHHYGSVSHKDVNHAALLAINETKFKAKWNGWIDEHGTISCAMIVKNEAHRIKGCLDHNLKHFDEFVIVDTGSTDDTVKIIEEYGDPKIKLHHFEWCDDFAKARNYANAQCTKEWIFSLDADEKIDGIDKSQMLPVNVIGFNTRNYCNVVNWKGWTANRGDYAEHEEGTTGWFPSFKIRLFRNDKRLRWVYPVHEVIEPSAFDVGYRRIAAIEPVHHQGKADLAADIEKGLRYYEYLKQRVEDDPNDYRHLEELATQAQNIGKFEEALELWERCLSLQPDFNGFLNKGHCLACLQRNQEALEVSQKAWELQPDSREAAMNVAVLQFRCGDLEEARRIAKEMMEKHPEYPIPVAVFNATERRMNGEEVMI